MDKAIAYIINFMLGEENADAARFVSYGNDDTARVVVEPSEFFDDGVFMTQRSLPQLPLRELDGLPILFGMPELEESDGRIILKADIVAGAFFLLTRYEECVRRGVRDKHGRFIGTESLSYRAGFLNRPIVDEYGALLRRLLRKTGVEVNEPRPGCQHVWLTHDVDEIWTWENIYRAVRSVGRRIIDRKDDVLLPIRAVANYKRYDPAYTFPWLIERDNAVRSSLGQKKCTPLYFIMGTTEKTNYDRGYLARCDRTEDLVRYLTDNDCEIGYHVSFMASLKQELVKAETERISRLAGRSITQSRNHYLASHEPEDFYSLIDAGITDDFTMGYADVVGFRLGTCRPVRWIDPIKRELTPLTLHPMTTMECTLDSYMGIQDEGIAYKTVMDLLRQIHANAGEVVLLWHNPSVYPSKESYQRSLYARLLQLLSGNQPA